MTDERVRRLRELAREGRLAAAAATARAAERSALTGAAYEVVWPIVFFRLTRRAEQSRGHTACAVGVDRLADECLDRFHDDVEAVVEDLLAHADRPVLQLEAWVSGRLTAATVDAHRRLRGRRGALQRPRLPGWIAAGLGHDPWLVVLATEILVWVGVSATAGSGTWPLEAWAQQRGVRTGDWPASEPRTVAREVETVLAVMRRRPDWYESYVERPLGAKRAPVAAAPVGDEAGGSARPLVLAGPHDRIDAELLRLAAEAVRAIDTRVTRGGAGGGHRGRRDPGRLRRGLHRHSGPFALRRGRSARRALRGAGGLAYGRPHRHHGHDHPQGEPRARPDLTRRGPRWVGRHPPRAEVTRVPAC
ncbi:hypothetical protein AB0M36_23215 [Actinoplanes sp. NPDC051346]|uniref:hypothetical protein n=1 Tax=Actinoplanes sp. NPDC051346 TaxID=3155048 RepID=UPI00343A1F54